MVVEAIALTSMLIGWPHKPNEYEDRGLERAVKREQTFDGVVVSKASCTPAYRHTAAKWFCHVSYRGAKVTDVMRVKVWEDGSFRTTWVGSLWPPVYVEPKR